MALNLNKIADNSTVWVKISKTEYDSLTANSSFEELVNNFHIKTVLHDDEVSSHTEYYKKDTPDANELSFAMIYSLKQRQDDLFKTLCSIKFMLRFFYILSIIGLIAFGIWLFIFIIGAIGG